MNEFKPGASVALREARAMLVVASSLLEESLRGGGIAQQERRIAETHDFLRVFEDLRREGRL